nr:hypothetical protein [Tanacetum cinerariifolium]
MWNLRIEKYFHIQDYALWDVIENDNSFKPVPRTTTNADDLEQIHEDDLQEIDLKWQLALLSMRARRYFQKTSKKITINGSDTAGYDKIKVECFNSHKMGHFARECKSPKKQESRLKNQDSSRKTVIMEDTSSKAMVAIDGVAVLTKSGIVPISIARQSSSRATTPISAARPINTASSKPLLNVVKPRSKAFKKLHSLSRRPFYQQTTLKNKDLNNNVNAAKANYVNTVKANSGLMLLSPQHVGFEDLKLKSKIMSPKIIDHTFVNNLTMLIQEADSRNISYLTDFKEHDGGYVAFGEGAKGGKITGKGTRTGKLDFEDVYFVKELQFNLFSVSQMCDKKNSVFFTDTECFVLSPKFKLANESQVLLKVPRKNNMTLIKAARTMLADSKLPTIFWAEAVSTACYVQNRTLVVKPHFKTPYELFKDEGIFVGYATTSNYFRVYNIRTRKVEENMHITFLENKPMIAGGGPEWLFDLDAISKSMNYAPVSAGSSQDYILMPLWKDNSLFVSSSQASDSHNKDKHGPSQASESDHHERPNVESSTRTVNTAGLVNTVDYPNDPLMPDLEDAGIFDDAYDDRDDGAEADYNNLETVISVTPIPSTRIHKDHHKEYIIGEMEPKNVTQALDDESWVEAMQEELLQFKLLNVWTLVDLPPRKRAIGTKWVYRNKRDQRGIVVRNKARLVAQGHRQEEGIYYDEVFAPVARIKAIRAGHGALIYKKLLSLTDGFFLTMIAVETSGSGNTFLLAVAFFFRQWEVPSGSGNFLTSSRNALCILFPTFLP